MDAIDPSLKVYLAHFSKGLSKQIKRYATDEVFKHSRYIFTRRQGKQQYGYCTHCSSEFKTDGFHHNSKNVCPECKSECTVKAGGLGRRQMVDEAYFVYYEKSVKDPKVIVARGIHAIRDYSDDYHEVKTLYLERSLYIFEMGNSVMLERYGYYSQARTMEHGTFSLRKSIYSMYSQFDSNFRRNMTTMTSQQSIAKAVKDTPFSWSGWESYNYDNLLKFFGLYSKYPCVEYLTKLGFEVLVQTKLDGGNTYGAINWRGKTLFKVLKLNKDELKEIKSSKVFVEPLFLKLMQMSRKDNSGLSLTEVSNIKRGYGNYLEDLQKLLRYTSFARVNSFINKQFKDKNEPIPGDKKGHRHYSSDNQVLFAWRDYVADCIKLGMNPLDEKVLFPGNLYNAHQNTIKQVQFQVDETLNKKIKLRAKTLNNYHFEYFGFLIRAAKDTKELIEEGKALNHCVGGYAARYAKGETDILFIRNASEPDKPYYTMEIRQGEIVQVRGEDNRSADEFVSGFINIFRAKKLHQEKAKSKAERIAIPA